MSGLSRSVRVWAYPQPADLRKGYNGLYGLVQHELGHDPLSGDLFLFVNRKRTSCKVLLWDGTGLCIFSKRLERGRFARLWREDAAVITLTTNELQLFIEGCLLRVHRQPRQEVPRLGRPSRRRAVALEALRRRRSTCARRSLCGSLHQPTGVCARRRSR